MIRAAYAGYSITEFPVKTAPRLTGKATGAKLGLVLQAEKEQRQPPLFFINYPFVDNRFSAYQLSEASGFGNFNSAMIFTVWKDEAVRYCLYYQKDSGG